MGSQIPLFSKPRKTTPKIPLRDLVLEAIAKHGPVTDDDLCRILRKAANSVRPRRIELVNMGSITQAGRKLRPGRRACTLWDVPRATQSKIVEG